MTDPVQIANALPAVDKRPTRQDARDMLAKLLLYVASNECYDEAHPTIKAILDAIAGEG
jgi:hypothetical protein